MPFRVTGRFCGNLLVGVNRKAFRAGGVIQRFLVNSYIRSGSFKGTTVAVRFQSQHE